MTDTHSVTLIDQKTFIGNRRLVLGTLDVTSYDGTTGAVVTASELGISRIIYISAVDAAAGFEAFVVQPTGTSGASSVQVHLRVSTTGLEVANNTNVHTTAAIAANLLVIGV